MRLLLLLLDRKENAIRMGIWMSVVRRHRRDKNDTKNLLFVIFCWRYERSHSHIHTAHSLTQSHIWYNGRKITIENHTYRSLPNSISFHVNSLLWKVIWNRKWIAQPFFSFFLGRSFFMLVHTHTCSADVYSFDHFYLATWFRTPLFWNNFSWIDSHIPETLDKTSKKQKKTEMKEKKSKLLD